MAGGDGQLRASDAERAHVIDVLRQHTVDGRLTLEEFEQRVDEAYAATTRGDLDPVLRDLPPLPPATPPATRTGPQRPPWPSPLDGGAVLRAVAVVAAVTVVLASGWQLWWIVFPLMVFLGGCGGSGARSCASSRSRHRSGYSAHDRRGHRRRGDHGPDDRRPDDRDLIRL
jgi:hypothetical protein